MANTGIGFEFANRHGNLTIAARNNNGSNAYIPFEYDATYHQFDVSNVAKVTISSAGIGINMVPVNVIDITATANNAQRVTIVNADPGGSAQAGYIAFNRSSRFVVNGILGDGWITTGPYHANGAFTLASDDLLIMAGAGSGSTGNVTLGAGATEICKVTSAGINVTGNIVQTIPTALNIHNYSMTASGMPSDLGLPSITGATSYRVTVTVSAFYSNQNGNALTATLGVRVKDGSTVLQLRTWAIIVPYPFSDKMTFTFSFDVPQPVAGAFTINITDDEVDGGSHTWTQMYVSASANTNK